MRPEKLSVCRQQLGPCPRTTDACSAHLLSPQEVWLISTTQLNHYPHIVGFSSSRFKQPFKFSVCLLWLCLARLSHGTGAATASLSTSATCQALHDWVLLLCFSIRLKQRLGCFVWRLLLCHETAAQHCGKRETLSGSNDHTLSGFRTCGFGCLALRSPHNCAPVYRNTTYNAMPCHGNAGHNATAAIIMCHPLSTVFHPVPIPISIITFAG